jgi:hypothetical protein
MIITLGICGRGDSRIAPPNRRHFITPGFIKKKREEL